MAKIKGIGIEIGSMEELMEHIASEMGGKGSTIASFYGVDEEQFDKWVKDMLCDCIQLDKKTDVIGKNFANVDAETRAKIFAYHVAMTKYRKSND